MVREPVRDCDGMARHRVRVARGEMTCVGCGEVAINGYCPRCGGMEDDEDGTVVQNAPPLVPTLSYLREGEWEGV